jgi:PKD repeat protein
LNNGEVRKITYTDTNNRAPTALATASPTAGIAPFAVVFNGAASSDPDAGDTISYDWNFGDGAPHATTVTTTHTYTRSGVFTATLIVTDDKGLASAPWQQKIQANNTPPTATITAPISMTKFSVGQVVTLTGKGADPQDGALAGSKLSWQVLLHHVSASNPQNKHTHPYAIGTGTPLSLTYPSPEDLDAAAGSYLEARLTATDAQGLTGTMTQTLQPARVTITVSAVSTQTAAYGLNAYVNGEEVVERQTFTAWQGWSLALSAPAFQQDLYAFWFRFGAWSDGGAAAHAVTVPATGATYTAYYGPSEKPNLVWLPLLLK